MAKTIGQLYVSSPATALSATDFFEIEQGGNSAACTASQLSAFILPQIPQIPTRGYIDGLICSNAADTDHDITISVGVCRDSTDTYTLITSSSITKQLDAAWVAGDNVGGLDTGTIASSLTYYIWDIRKDSDGSTDKLFSLSATSPTMPSGYTYKRRIGAILTDTSANIIQFNQTSDRFILKQPIESRALSVLSSTARNAYTAATPPSMIAILSIVSFVSTTGSQYLWIGDLNRTDAAASSSNYDIRSNIEQVIGSTYWEVLTSTNSNIFIRGSSTVISFGFFTRGWYDYREKNK